MQTRKLNLVLALGVFLLVGFNFPAAAQRRGPVELPSVAHATSPPLRSYGVAPAHKKPFGPPRVIPLLRPETAGSAAKGGAGANAAPAIGGTWSDLDLQTSYNSSQLTLDKVFPGFSFSGYLPPDENISVGINSTGTNPQTQVVAVVNTSYAIYNTSGNSIASGDLAANLFGNIRNSVCSSEDGGDPLALYDKLAGRWIISQLAYNSNFTDNHLCLAISQTSDAAGGYDLYDIPFNSNLPDYPKLAVWPDGIYFSANIYSSNGNALQFDGAQACSFPSIDVTNPPANGRITFSCSPGNDSSIYNILPADLENLPGTSTLPSGSDYYLQFVDNVSPSSGNILRLYQFDPTVGTLSKVTDLTVKDFHEACGGGSCIPQTGTNQELDSLGDRLMYRLSYRDYGTYQQMVANQSVQVDSGSMQTGIRWYAIRRDQSGSFHVDKESTFSPDVSTYRWMGSIAQNKYGDLGLGYSTSGVTSVPGIAVTGLLNGTDALMEKGQSMYNGSDQSYQGSYNRWGDYSSVSVDPSDDCSFWYTNEYVTPPVLSFDFLWQTEIGKFSFADCSGSTTTSFTMVPSPATQTVTAGTTNVQYSINVTASSGYKGTVNLSVASGCPTNSTCTLSASQLDFGSTTSSTLTSTLTVDTTASTPAQNYTIVVKGSDSNDISITSQTSVQLAVTDFSLISNPSSQTVTAGTNATYTIAANALNGFTGTISSLVVGTCPAPLSCSLSASSVTAGDPTSTSTLTASGTGSVTTATNFNIVVTGTSSGLTHSVTAGLTVNPPAVGDFSISATPGSLTLKTGHSGSYTVSAAPSGGFNGNVTVSADCPTSSGFSCQVSNNGIIAGGNGSVTYTVADGSAPRRTSYTITFTATSGSLVHTTSVGLKAR